MAEATFNFPRGFLWGTATSSHQVEGNNTNNSWWVWEQEPGHIINAHKSGLACDWWGGRWREDFDRAVEAHQNAHRLSIEWSRIQPAPDRWDEDALDHYRQILRGLRDRNLTILITLHHFTDPQWLLERQGWLTGEAVDYYITYVRKVVEALKEYTSIWMTFNEPNLYTLFGYVQGVFPPGKQDMRAALTVAINILHAHAGAYHAIHNLQPQARVGIVHYYLSLKAVKPWFPLDRLVRNIQFNLVNNLFTSALSSGVIHLPVFGKRLPKAKGTLDFIGIDYYTRMRVRFNLFKPGELFGERLFPPNAELSEDGWIANEPEGIFEAIQWGLRLKLPIIITENGVNDTEDHLRPRYLIQHLHQVWRAVNFNYPVKGYFHWTLVDNFEWERGWTQRFGLWALDVDSQVRTKRPSADLYAEICKNNGISSGMVRHYAPETFEKTFPE
jgi:beta-glucosidase